MTYSILVPNIIFLVHRLYAMQMRIHKLKLKIFNNCESASLVFRIPTDRVTGFTALMFT